mmetsp:Transcript_22691/g.60487  ORF Transcript_22691/g.60487 Transcript_22691/m.60487 type:complete len:389 (+) Transcript_22691:97-1263(+)
MACRALAAFCLVLACPVVGGIPCGSKVTTFDFTNAEIVHNNLGGFGPNAGDPEEIRYGNLGTLLDGTPVGLVITVANENGNVYQAANAAKNGVHNGMGQINVAGSSKVLLNFQVINTNTGKELCIGPAGMTFYDLDGGNGNNDHKQYEVISVCPNDATVLSDAYNPPYNVPTNVEEANRINPNCLAWKMKDPISNVQDPTDPDKLTDEQVAQTLTELWSNLCNFQVYFEAVNGAANSGRNFWFTGLGSQTNECPCEDQSCGICKPGHTCAEAIACKVDELANGFDSNEGEDLSSDEQCSIALSAVHESCHSCDACDECAGLPTRLLDDEPKISGAAAERSPLKAALAVGFLSVAGVAAVLVELRQRASESLALATATDTQSETDGQLS